MADRPIRAGGVPTFQVQLNPQGAFARFTLLVSNSMLPHLRKVYELHADVILKSMIADASGEDHGPSKPAVEHPTRDEQFLSKLVGFIIEIRDALDTLADSHVYMRRSGGRNSDVPLGRYIRYHFEH